MRRQWASCNERLLVPRQQRMEANDSNRCIAMMDPKIATSVGWCYENLKKTWQGKNRKNLLLIERVDLVKDPEAVLAKIYDFLEIPAAFLLKHTHANQLVFRIRPGFRAACAAPAEGTYDRSKFCFRSKSIG